MALFNRVTIVGLGLIGGSLGMAIRRTRAAREVVGFSRKAATLKQAKRVGAIDRGFTSLAQAVKGAELVVLATPVETIVPYARRAARFMSRGSLLMDVGSTKAQIVDDLERSLSPHVTFVGTHPLAGSEQRGLQAARPRLFEGSVCLVTATTRTPRRVLQRVKRLWRTLAHQVVVMDPQRHDRLVAAVSHLPHLLAFALVQATDHQALVWAPRSFLEATRVASSDPDLWDDILLSNRRAVLAAIHRFDRTWQEARHLLLQADGRRLRHFLRQAQAIRQRLPD